MLKIFEHNDFTMRMVEEPDLVKLADHRNSPEVWGNLTSPIPVAHHNQNAWLHSLYKNDMYFIAQRREASGDIGLIRITDIDWVNRNAAVGLDIFSEHRGNHLAKGVFALAVKYSFDVLNLHRLWLMVIEGNAPAIKTYQDAGFEIEGVMKKHLFKNGEYRDYIVMGKLNDNSI